MNCFKERIMPALNACYYSVCHSFVRESFAPSMLEVETKTKLLVES